MSLSPELLTKATNLWGHYRRHEISYDELDKRLVKLEREYGVDQTICEGCNERHATLSEDGHLVCATGRCLSEARANAALPDGDAVDRGWQRYNEEQDRREQVGGLGL